MISETSVEAALDYLRDSAPEYGHSAGRVEAAQHLIKQYIAEAFLDCKGTVAEREAAARLRDDVKAAQDEHADAVREYRTIIALRKAAELRIEVWRTQQASNRAKTV